MQDVYFLNFMFSGPPVENVYSSIIDVSFRKYETWLSLLLSLYQSGGFFSSFRTTSCMKRSERRHFHLLWKCLQFTPLPHAPSQMELKAQMTKASPVLYSESGKNGNSHFSVLRHKDESCEIIFPNKLLTVKDINVSSLTVNRVHQGGTGHHLKICWPSCQNCPVMVIS